RDRRPRMKGTLDGRLGKAVQSLRWLPAYGWRCMKKRPPDDGPVHLMIAIANHFEPEWAGTPGAYADRAERERRVDSWCRTYPHMADPWRDAEGMPVRHTYFYPAEHYDKGLLDRLAMHCRDGWGEVEIHLHHGIERPDTAENTRRMLQSFRAALAEH